jgi:glycolate oxidase FAD binding subunit
MRWANEAGVGVLPLASGARLRPRREGGRPAGGWVALLTDRLSGIEIYEAADLTLTARAGTSMRKVDDALRANGQWAPFDPPHLHDRSLAGFVADGSSGPLWCGYGELRNHVLGMTVVTGDGRTLRLGGRVVKNVAGFDLVKPMTGSRGTLAVLTSVTLRAFPLPPEDLLLTCDGASVSELLPLALRVGTAPVLPVSCVVADADTRRLLVRLHGAASTVAADRVTLQAHLGRELQAAEPADAGALLEVIRDHASGADTVVEASVRPSRLQELLRAAEHLPTEAIVVDTYAGRVRLGLAAVDAAELGRFTSKADELGGAVAMHRASRGQSASAGSEPSADESALVGRLRDAFDPRGVLWPAR